MWPEPPNSFSACAGLIVTASFGPRLSSIAGSARAIDGMDRAAPNAPRGCPCASGWGCEQRRWRPAPQRPQPLAARLHVRGQRARDRRGAAARIDDQLASDVEAREVVIVGLGDRQAVAGEDQLGLDRRGRLDPRVDDRVPAQASGSWPARLTSVRLESGLVDLP